MVTGGGPLALAGIVVHCLGCGRLRCESFLFIDGFGQRGRLVLKVRARRVIDDLGVMAVSYTHLTLPTIYSV